jgi:CheY-like chemotaxis protein
MEDTILIIEDSADDAKWLKLILDEAGVANPSQVIPSGTEAVAYLDGAFPYSDRSQYPLPGIILLDLKLPGLDGFQLLEWLRSRADFKNTLAVAVSGLDDLASIRRAYRLGANSFLTKPCQVADLENLVAGFPDHWTRSEWARPHAHSNRSAAEEALAGRRPVAD